MATVFTACTPYGARYSSNPEARRRPPPPPPRFASSAYVDCHTVRKQTTWRQRPEDTASIAAMSDPAAPGVSGAPLCQVGRRPSADSTAVTPPSEYPPSAVPAG